MNRYTFSSYFLNRIIQKRISYKTKPSLQIFRCLIFYTESLDTYTHTNWYRDHLYIESIELSSIPLRCLLYTTDRSRIYCAPYGSIYTENPYTRHYRIYKMYTRRSDRWRTETRRVNSSDWMEAIRLRVRGSISKSAPLSLFRPVSPWILFVSRYFRTMAWIFFIALSIWHSYRLICSVCV